MKTEKEIIEEVLKEDFTEKFLDSWEDELKDSFKKALKLQKEEFNKKLEALKINIREMMDFKQSDELKGEAIIKEIDKIFGENQNENT